MQRGRFLCADLYAGNSVLAQRRCSVSACNSQIKNTHLYKRIGPVIARQPCCAWGLPILAAFCISCRLLAAKRGVRAQPALEPLARPCIDGPARAREEMKRVVGEAPRQEAPGRHQRVQQRQHLVCVRGQPALVQVLGRTG